MVIKEKKDPKFSYHILERNPRGIVVTDRNEKVESELWALLEDGSFSPMHTYMKSSYTYNSELYKSLGKGVPIGRVSKNKLWDAQVTQFFKKYPQYKKKFEDHLKCLRE